MEIYWFAIVSMILLMITLIHLFNWLTRIIFYDSDENNGAVFVFVLIVFCLIMWGCTYGLLEWSGKLFALTKNETISKSALGFGFSISGAVLLSVHNLYNWFIRKIYYNDKSSIYTNIALYIVSTIILIALTLPLFWYFIKWGVLFFL